MSRLNYIKSNAITVFPAGFRGQAYNKSKFTTEDNLTTFAYLSSNQLNNNQFYKDPYDASRYIVYIKGYYFNIAEIDIPGVNGGKPVYAFIQLISKTDVDKNGKSLDIVGYVLGSVEYKESDASTHPAKFILDNESNNFVGLGFCDNIDDIQSLPNVYYVKITDDIGNLKAQELKLDAKEIRSNDAENTSIDEVFGSNKIKTNYIQARGSEPIEIDNIIYAVTARNDGKYKVEVNADTTINSTVSINSPVNFGAASTGAVNIKSAGEEETTIIGPNDGVINLPANTESDYMVFVQSKGNSSWLSYSKLSTAANTLVQRDGTNINIDTINSAKIRKDNTTLIMEAGTGKVEVKGTINLADASDSIALKNGAEVDLDAATVEIKTNLIKAQVGTASMQIEDAAATIKAKTDINAVLNVDAPLHVGSDQAKGRINISSSDNNTSDIIGTGNGTVYLPNSKAQTTTGDYVWVQSYNTSTKAYTNTWVKISATAGSANTIVKTDSKGKIAYAISGNADTATKISQTASTGNGNYPVFLTNDTGKTQITPVYSTKITANPSSGNFKASTFNSLTLTSQTTGLKVSGGTTSKYIDVQADTTISAPLNIEGTGTVKIKSAGTNTTTIIGPNNGETCLPDSNGLAKDGVTRVWVQSRATNGAYSNTWVKISAEAGNVDTIVKTNSDGNIAYDVAGTAAQANKGKINSSSTNSDYAVLLTTSSTNNAYTTPVFNTKIKANPSTGNFSASKFNNLSLTSQTTGFKITGGTTSKYIDIQADTTFKATASVEAATTIKQALTVNAPLNVGATNQTGTVNIKSGGTSATTIVGANGGSVYLPNSASIPVDNTTHIWVQTKSGTAYTNQWLPVSASTGSANTIIMTDSNGDLNVPVKGTSENATSIYQETNSGNAAYPILFTTNSTSGSYVKVKYNTGVTINPSTKELSATKFKGSGAGLTSLNATNISSGTLDAARLATSGATAGNYGPADTELLPGYGDGFNVPYLTVDDKGRVTSIITKKVTLPSSDNVDTKVTQTNTTTNASYRVLFSASANDTTSTEGARKSAKLKFNPSIGTLSATNFSGNGASLTDINASNISSGTLAAARLATSGVSAGNYGPTADVTGNDTATIKIPYLTVDDKGRVTSITEKTYTSVNTYVNWYHTPKFSAGINIADGTGRNALYVPTATGNQKGVTYLYADDECTTYTSNDGATTPAAVNKAFQVFTATADKYGTVKIGYTASGNNYPVKLDTNGKMYVTHGDTSTLSGAYGPTAGGTQATKGTLDIIVPQITVDALGHVTDVTNKTFTVTDTDTNTHNSHAVISGKKADGSTDIKGSASSSDITLGDSGVTAGEYGPTADATPGYGDTFNIPDIKVNAKGIVTSVTNRTITLPSSDNVDTKVTQAYSTAGNNYPLLFSATSGTSSTSSRGATTAILCNKIYANPSTGTLTATYFSGNGSSLTSLNASNISSGTIALARIPTGTASTQVALGNHNHSTSIAASSSTNQLTLAFGTKYAITAGGTSYVFTMPSNPNTDSNVQQTQVSSSSYNYNYPLLLAGNSTSTTSNQTTTTYKNCNKLYANPYSGQLTATTFNATSDARLKENFREFIPKKSILELPVWKFDFKEGELKDQIGCKAQDLREICPEIVFEDEDTGYLSIQENKLVYLLLDEVKKLKAEIEELKTR